MNGDELVLLMFLGILFVIVVIAIITMLCLDYRDKHKFDKHNITQKGYEKFVINRRVE